MTFGTEVSARHVNAYHHDNALLFQFILSEMLAAFEEVRVLDTICKQCPQPSHIDHFYLLQNQSLQHQIEVSFTILVGSGNNPLGLLSGSSAEGVLGKLKIYASLFLQNSEQENKEFFAIQKHSQKIWKECIQALHSWAEDPVDRTLFFSLMEKAIQTVYKLAKLIAKAIKQFRDDENVMFYIIRHQREFDLIYGNAFVYKLLHRFYPKGFDSAQQFLSEQYTERGFNQIVPIIADKLSKIKVAQP